MIIFKGNAFGNNRKIADKSVFTLLDDNRKIADKSVSTLLDDNRKIADKSVSTLLDDNRKIADKSVSTLLDASGLRLQFFSKKKLQRVNLDIHYLWISLFQT
jgi:hypothetical protein